MALLPPMKLIPRRMYINKNHPPLMSQLKASFNQQNRLLQRGESWCCMHFHSVQSVSGPLSLVARQRLDQDKA